MYLCGHPGTGKTSLLNQVIARLNQDETTPEFELFLYNAMTYSDVKSFGITLHFDVNNRLQVSEDDENKRLQRSQIDDELLANNVVMVLA
jgi:Cdc6-like AAA superfamily ATPase